MTNFQRHPYLRYAAIATAVAATLAALWTIQPVEVKAADHAKFYDAPAIERLLRQSWSAAPRGDGFVIYADVSRSDYIILRSLINTNERMQ